MLFQSKAGAQRGLSLPELASATGTDALQVEPVVEALRVLDWVAWLDEAVGQRLVLLIDPATTAARPLVDEMLLEPSAAVGRFRERTGIDGLMVGELI